MAYYKVTYNQPGFRYYQVIEASQLANSKWHAIEQVFSKKETEFSERKFYKAKLLK